MLIKSESLSSKFDQKGSGDNKETMPFVCELCGKKFYFCSTFDKHMKLYPNKHQHYKCCNKIEISEKIHTCRKSSVKNCNIKEKKLGSNDEEDDKSKSEMFRKEKRSYKKKPITDIEKEEDNKSNMFNCQECSKSFNKYFSLSQHIKIVHKNQGILKCLICEEEFSKEEEFEAHSVMHGPEDKVICKGCQKMFDTLKAYYVHAKQNPGVHSFLCKLCLRKFPTELVLEQHVCICQNGKPLYCACGKEFTKYKDVVAHSKGTKPFYCCSCPHLSTSLTAYIRHLRKHSKQKPYQCTKCDMKFAVIDFLNIHIRKNHNEEVPPERVTISEAKKYICNVCDEKCETDEALKEHGLQHERVQCPDCGKLLKRNRLENHRNTHKTSASLCPECGKLFETRFKLTQHIITAHNSEPVKCEVCAKVLKTKKILNEHMKTHLKSEMGGRVPQAICPMCGLGLAQKGSLARHILLTHEKHKIVPCDRTYTCHECSEVLPNRVKYYSHRRMHRAMVDRFPCEVCGREFNKKQNLRRHIYLLHDEKRVLADPIFKCQICTRSFREKKNLKRHYKMVHKLEDFI